MNYRQLFCALFLPLAIAMVSCGGDDGESDCTGPLCPFVGNWQLHEVAVDGSDVDGDYSGYRLELKAPESDPSFADFVRMPGDGNVDAGEWRLSNNDDVLVLNTADGDEEYIIGESGSNTLMLILNRTGDKPGPSQIRYGFKK